MRVMNNKNNLKNTQCRVVKDLTRYSSQILWLAKDHPNALTVWSRAGQIYAKTIDLKIIQVNKVSDLDDLEIDGNLASTPRS